VTRTAAPGEGPRRAGFLRRLWRRRTAGAGIVILGLVVLAGAGAPLIAPFDPAEMRTADRFSPPGRGHWLGTDMYGRDVLSRVVWGARVSLAVAVGAVAASGVAALVLGLTAGYVGGLVDDALMRVLDIAFAFPTLLLAIALIGFLGPGLPNATLAVAIVFTPPLSRVVRASVLAVKHAIYVDAARAIGASDLRLVGRHILPNGWSPLIVQCTVYLAYAVLTEASLSFLGLGVQPPTPSWGEMLSTSRTFLHVAPWGAVFPGLALSATVLGFNFVGDGLRDALDPRLG
jgi:peptide/nickel transport system permease protein